MAQRREVPALGGEEMGDLDGELRLEALHFF